MCGQRHAPATLYPGKDPVPIVQKAGWAPGLVWTGAENLSATGIRSPDRPARRQSLYRLSYRGPHRVNALRFKIGVRENRDSSDWVRVLAGEIFHLRNVLKGSVAHPTSCPVDVGESFAGGRAAEA